MAELVPIPPGPVFGDAGAPVLARLRGAAAQPAVRRALPWFGSLAGLGALALAWNAIAPAPQRVLYSELADGEKGAVVAALDKAGIAYAIDENGGALTVDADELYRARMLVASDGALASPETGNDLLDKLPLGASRAIEGDRLRAAREHELMLTILEIDGVESARVHLAEPRQSVFVHDNVPPSASVMVRLARGKQLSESQVSAIVSLVSASVPGLAVDAVRIADQHGRLLSAAQSGETDRLELQARMEEKLRGQLDQLLGPMLGNGNYSSEIQVELDMDEVTSARESYDKQGVVRSESQSQSQTQGAGQAGGVPGALANTPPPAAVASPGPPQGSQLPNAGGQTSGETNSTRTYELGREVSVANTGPGKLKRLSVAVALSKAAMPQGKPADVDAIKQLVSAAVGANTQRGDQVAVMIRPFQPVDESSVPFFETPWFAMLVRSMLGLIGVVLVLLLAVRPLLKVLRRDPPQSASGEGAASQEIVADPGLLNRQVALAQQMVSDQPENAVTALRQLLSQPTGDQP